ncbi:MAG: ribonuclease III [Ignavibacteriae bacterium]|nr:ribonuclease III [Ignavibacteriota bacterium]
MNDFIRRILAWLREEQTSDSSSITAEINFERLQRVIKHRIKNKSLFSEALSHRSYINKPENGTLVSNERLEFLGDSVLNMVVGEYLFHRHASLPEGDLTKMRSRLVNRKALSAYAGLIDLQEFILIGASIPRSVERGLEKILADAYEALVAAIYLDGGFRAAEQFVQRQMVAAVEQRLVVTEDANFKSQLLEYSQAESLSIPRYVTIKEDGPDHDRVFTVEVYLGDEPYGVGMGKNKKDAEQAAAEKALQKFQLV